MMGIEIRWEPIIYLKDGGKHDLIYHSEHIEKYNERAGVYVFGRKHGDKISPLYIGKSINLGQRLSQQLNSVKLMNKLLNENAGSRILIVGLYDSINTNVDEKIGIIEKALINNALSQGYELFNKQLTAIQVHEINFHGNQEVKTLFGKTIFFPKKMC